MCVTSLSRLALALTLAFGGPTALAAPPHYHLIDYGTLGGPNSSYWAKGRILNNGGAMIYQPDLNAPDPYGLSEDGFLSGGVVARGKSIGVLNSPFGNPTGEFIAPIWITDNGLIAGLVTQKDPSTGAPKFRAVVWQGGRDISLGDFGGNGSEAFAANTAGMVVGVALNTVPDDMGSRFFIWDTSTQSRAFVWQRGVMQDIGTLGGTDAAATSVNRVGQVAGNSLVDASTIHPFLWQNGHMVDVGSLGGSESVIGQIDDYASGRTLNSRGQIAGVSYLSGDATWHAFRWANGRIQDLGTLGGPNSDPFDMNDGGDIVGRADVSMDSIAHHAFLWRNGRMTDLGTLPGCDNTTARSVNDRDDVVGVISLCQDDALPRAWLAERGGHVVDLNDLVVDNPGMLIFEAFYINNAGDIAAEGLLPSGDVHSILLTPASSTAPVGQSTVHVKPDLQSAAFRWILKDQHVRPLSVRHH